jgi:hypothetical protein
MALIPHGTVRNEFAKKHLPADGHSSRDLSRSIESPVSLETRSASAELAARQLGKMRAHAVRVRLGTTEQTEGAGRLEHGHAGA